jgi:transcriptional regulator with XRE-family HTH domain
MLGNELRNYRLAASMTQEKLGFEAGLDRTYISQLERNLKSPTVDTLFRICDALGISASELIARVEKSRKVSRRK